MLPCLAVIIINDICTVIFDRSFCIEHIPRDVKYIYINFKTNGHLIIFKFATLPKQYLYYSKGILVYVLHYL